MLCLAFTMLTVGAGEAFIEGRDQVDDTWVLLERTTEALDELEQVYVGRTKRPRARAEA